MTLLEKLNRPGPKRILALDGGGIRGALTLGYLQKIEQILQDRHKNKNLRLSDYFDLIGGTSTGSIIAAALAIGKKVNDITEMYMSLGGKIFGEKRDWWNPVETFKYIRAEFSMKPLETELKNFFKDPETGRAIALGSDNILTGLCIVAKRADTNSVWPIINHPNGKFFETAAGKNKNIPLWKAIRASTAAPTYFVPEIIEIGDKMTGAFVDGGVSMANNPSLQLLMVATLKGFPFHWQMGENKLLLVSVGTGYSIPTRLPKDISDNKLWNWAQEIPDMLMQDASWQNQVILQWLSDSPTASEIDSEVGNLHGDFLASQPVLSYLRYNTPITEKSLNDIEVKDTNGESYPVFTKEDVKSIIEMSNAKNRHKLFDIGYAAAEKEIRSSHFPTAFEI